MMRWTFRILGVLALAWLVFVASPFVALNNFAREIEARDVEAVSRRVSFRALRISLLRQVLGAYAQERGRSLDEGQRQVAVELGISVAEPIVAPLLTAEAIIQLLDGRSPAGAAAPESGAAPTQGAPVAAHLRLRSLRSAWELFLASELRGFRQFVVTLPPGRAADQRFRLRLRLVRTTWKLVAIELPPPLVQELLRKAPGLRQGASEPAPESKGAAEAAPSELPGPTGLRPSAR